MPETSVLVLFAKLQEQISDEKFGELAALLPLNRQQKLGRFRKWQDAQRGLLGWLLLLRGLKQLGYLHYSLSQLKFNEYDRPYFDERVDFNISHSGEYVVCAITDDCQVGIDVEEIREVPVLEFEREFSKSELNDISGAENSLAKFYEYWTQKEAFLKAIGTGLNVPLNKVGIKDDIIDWKGKPWYLKEIYLDGKHICHLCSNNYMSAQKVEAVSFY